MSSKVSKDLDCSQ